jgi:hypothetical protein
MIELPCGAYVVKHLPTIDVGRKVVTAIEPCRWARQVGN